MSAQKDPAIFELQTSLINHLLMKNDIAEKVPGGSRRIRALIFNIDSVSSKKMFFKVQIGVFEAVFDINTGLKVRGYCYGLDRYIRDWYERTTVTMTVNKYVQDTKRKLNKKES